MKVEALEIASLYIKMGYAYGALLLTLLLRIWVRRKK